MSLRDVRNLRIQRAFQVRRERQLLAIMKDVNVCSKTRYFAAVMAEEFREHIDKIDARLSKLKAQSHG